MAKTKGKKQPKSIASVPTGKEPVSTWPSVDQSRERICWRFGDVEFEGCDWGWHRITAEEIRWAQAWLAQMEKLTWGEAYNKKGPGVKLVRVAQAPAHVKRRLEAIERDDVEQLVEFHPAGKPRIWGVRVDNVCHLLWWDPEHGVWPSKLKRT